jgi:hypothetical protein
LALSHSLSNNFFHYPETVIGEVLGLIFCPFDSKPSGSPEAFVVHCNLVSRTLTAVVSIKDASCQRSGAHDLVDKFLVGVDDFATSAIAETAPQLAVALTSDLIKTSRKKTSLLVSLGPSLCRRPLEFMSGVEPPIGRHISGRLDSYSASSFPTATPARQSSALLPTGCADFCLSDPPAALYQAASLPAF